jgi:nucleoside triphosphate pyrophosphatase
MPLWLDSWPVVLASKSGSRRALLEAAGIPVQIHPADIDERAIEARAGATDPAAVALLLARAKAIAVAGLMPGRLVLGADQTLALGTRRFSKPKDRGAAAEQLRSLRGQVHTLHSAVALARDGAIVFEHVDIARLTMRAFSEDFLQGYLDTAGDVVTASVGAYQLEGLGVQLFEQVEGAHPTILGLPLLPLLDWLRKAKLLAG